MDIKVVYSLDPKVWRSFVEGLPNGNIFHTPEMYQVFEQTHGCKPQLMAAVESNGQVLALHTPVLVSLNDGLFRRITTRSIVYGGLLYKPDDKGKAALELLLKESTSGTLNKALFTEVRNLSDEQNVQDVFLKCGYAYEDHLNYLIDMQDTAENMMQKIGARTRKNIRRALRKQQVVVELVDSASRLTSWYGLVKDTYTRARVPLADFSLFKAAYEILSPKGMARFYLARVNSTYVAATAELLYKDMIYGWYSGVDRAFNSECPGELLMWEILRWGSENGYKVYDFGGAGKPNEHSGVRNFKDKFGGRLVCYGRNTKIHAPGLLRLSRIGYGLYRQTLNIFTPRLPNISQQ